MNRTELKKQEIRLMQFELLYNDWTAGRLSREDAARALGVSSRTFRRHIHRYEEDGLEGLYDRRMSQESHRRAPVDEAMALAETYRRSHEGWSVSHFYSFYKRDGGKRSYNWVLQTLHRYNAIPLKPSGGKHRKRREPRPMPGMMLHQDASTHQWVPGVYWDLVVTMDDATNLHTSMFFCEQEGTMSSFRGVRETIEAHGLFCELYTDRGSHYWHTPEVDGRVDKTNPTQFGRAMRQLGVQMVPAYSPEARGRSERAFRTHQDRLVKELAMASITDMEAANEYIRTVYLPNFNAEFTRQAREDGTAFVAYPDPDSLDDILCELHERTVGKDNCVKFERLVLQIPADRHRNHYVKATVVVRRHMDGTLSIHHGHRLLARYHPDGIDMEQELEAAE